MSWVYLPGPAEDCLPPGCLGGERSAQLRSSPTANVSSSSASATDTLSLSRSGTTYGLSTGVPGEDESTLCPEASLARTLAVLDPGVDWTAVAHHFGSRCCALLEKFGLRMSSLRIPLICAREAWTLSPKGLPAWGMSAHGACWALGTLARPSKESASGSWPSPTRSMGFKRHWGIARNPAATSRPRYGAARVAAWERETAKFGNCPRPSRVEWLMGWPIGWSACAPLETDRFQQWLRSHGAF
jgi:hypothetical protein